VAQNEALHRQLLEISDAMLAEIRKWASDDWIKKCESPGRYPRRQAPRPPHCHPLPTRDRRCERAVREAARDLTPSARLPIRCLIARESIFERADALLLLGRVDSNHRLRDPASAE